MPLQQQQDLKHDVTLQVEAELTELDKTEAAEYLASLGAASGGLANLIKATYKQLGLITYFTTGG